MSVKKRRPTPAFEIKLDAPGLRPGDVNARALWKIIIAVQRLIEHSEPETSEEDLEEPLRPEAAIQLLDVKYGSATYPVGATDGTAALRVLSETGRLLCHPAKAEWDSSTLSSIQDISSAAKAIGCEVEIKMPGKEGQVLAKITPTSYEEISGSAFVTGESSVYGYLERVGGATQPHCGLRIATQPSKMIICHLANKELAQQLGQHVYSYVRVTGTVTWLRRNWHIRSIEIRAFESAESGSIREALDAIWEAGGKAWDEVDDPNAVIRELR